jgi:hypothetical protein
VDGTVTSIVMDQPDRWDAGAALMKVANPEAWDTLAADRRLITGNKAQRQSRQSVPDTGRRHPQASAMPNHRPAGSVSVRQLCPRRIGQTGVNRTEVEDD